MTASDWKKLDFENKYKHLSELSYHDFVKRDHYRVETLLYILPDIITNKKYDKIIFNVIINQFDSFNYDKEYFINLLELFAIIGKYTETLKFSLTNVPCYVDLATHFPRVKRMILLPMTDMSTSLESDTRLFGPYLNEFKELEEI